MKKFLPFGEKLFLLLSFLFVGQMFSQAPLLDPVSHPKFVNELPVPAVLEPVSGNYYKVYIMPTTQDLGLYGIDGQPLGKVTDVWGYGPDADHITFPGPTIEARKYETIQVDWVNQLPADHLFEIDKTIHWAGSDMGGVLPDWENGESFNGIPTITHLHGGHTDADSDGHPEAWYTPGFAYTGSNFYDNGGVFTYDNSQEAATLWYHDHVIGITRLNVYAGLAGFYLLRDSHEDGLNLPKDQHIDLNDDTSPIEHFEIPLVIQDRIFDSDGQLVYPTETFSDPDDSDNIIYNSILPEVFGDYILVNGVAWPKLDVQPRKYRLRFLNGSDSRFYDLNFGSPSNPNNAVMFNLIGSDGGFLDAPIMKERLLIGPGERIDVIVDFSAPELWNQQIVLKNRARSPFPFGDTADPRTSGQIMAFNVNTPLTNPDTSEIPTSLRNTPSTVSESSEKTRGLVLFEEEDEYGRLLPSLGTVEDGALGFIEEEELAITENPDYKTAETWKIYNTTPDAHPIHLHLVHFQVISTQKFNVKKSSFGTGENWSAPLLGKPQPPAPENAGRKDTFIVYPGEVATVKAYFDKKGEYVWHCHILSHEDHDMMRPFYVGDYTPAVVASMQSIALSPESLELLSIAPNPMLDQAQISFRMNADSSVLLEVYDMSSRLVSTLYNGFAAANQDYNVSFDRSGLPSGTYIAKLSTADGRSFEKYIVAK